MQGNFVLRISTLNLDSVRLASGGTDVFNWQQNHLWSHEILLQSNKLTQNRKSVVDVNNIYEKNTHLKPAQANFFPLWALVWYKQ